MIAKGGGRFAVVIPTTASGRSARYVALAITTAGRTLVSWAPTRMPITTSPGFNPDPLIPQHRSGARMRPCNRSYLHRSRNRTSRFYGSARVPLIAPPARIVPSPRPEATVGRHPPMKLPARLAAFPYPCIQYIGQLIRGFARHLDVSSSYTANLRPLFVWFELAVFPRVF